METQSTDRLKAVVEDVVKGTAPNALIESRVAHDEVTLLVDKRWIHEIVKAFKEDPRLEFGMLSEVTAIDWLEEAREPRFDVVYNLVSLTQEHRIRLRAPVGEAEEECRIDTITDLWTGASFMEREVFDMFGIRFDGHPDLRRILMPDNWDGHPLRKDFPLGGSTSFYYKQDTDEYAGEPDDLVPRIRVQDSDV